MTPEDLIQKINKLDKSEYEEDAIAQMEAWKKQLELSIARRSLAENGVVKEILEDLRRQIDEINASLLEKSRIMHLLERPYELIALYDKRELYQNFLAKFDTSDSEEIARALEDIV